MDDASREKGVVAAATDSLVKSGCSDLSSSLIRQSSAYSVAMGGAEFTRCTVPADAPPRTSTNAFSGISVRHNFRVTIRDSQGDGRGRFRHTFCS